MNMTKEQLVTAVLPIAKAAAESSDYNVRRAAGVLFTLLGSLTAGTFEMTELFLVVGEVTKVQAARAETVVRALRR